MKTCLQSYDSLRQVTMTKHQLMVPGIVHWPQATVAYNHDGPIICVRNPRVDTRRRYNYWKRWLKDQQDPRAKPALSL